MLSVSTFSITYPLYSSSIVDKAGNTFDLSSSVSAWRVIDCASPPPLTTPVPIPLALTDILSGVSKLAVTSVLSSSSSNSGNSFWSTDLNGLSTNIKLTTNISTPPINANKNT